MKTLDTPPYLINGQHPITLCVIGCGGTGSLFLTKLVRLHKALNFLDHPGFYVTAVDYDKVEEFNIGRQMFTEEDIGRNKAECLISKINLAFNTDWVSVSKKASDKMLNHNFIVSCVDNAKTKTDLINWFYKGYEKKIIREPYNQKMFFIDCGNARDYGQVIMFDIEKKLKNTFDFFGKDLEKYDTIEEQGEGCQYIEKLQEQDLFINDWVSLYAVRIIKEMLFQKQINYQGFFFNTKEDVINKILL